MPAFSALVENFNAGELPVGWDQWNSGSPTFSYADGRFTLTTTNNNFGGVVTENAYDITGDSVHVEMAVKVAVTGGNRLTEWGFEVRDSSNNRYAFLLDYNGAADTGLIRGVRQNSSFTTQETIFSGLSFNYADHRWFRIRESGNAVIFETAPSTGGAPGTWTQRGTATWSTVSKTALFAASRSFTATGNGTGVAVYDNVNNTVGPFTPGASGANVFTADLQPTNSTDAHFRLWVTFIRNAFLAGGWVQTTDSEQMDHTTITRPLGTQVQKGYMIFRMDDSLQATKPIFVKIYFGSGAAANSPGIWIIIGTGSDGGGLLTGTMFLQLGSDHIYTSSNGTGLVTSSHASSSPSHCAVALFVNSSNAYILTFSIERGRTAAGAEDGDHLFLQYSNGPSGGLNRFTYLVRSAGLGGSQSSLFTGAPAIISPGRPVHTQADVGYGNIIPFKPGVGGAQPVPPCLGYIVMEDDSWTTDAQVTLYKYGTTVVYRRLYTVRHSMPSAVLTTNHSVWQRYD